MIAFRGVATSDVYSSSEGLPRDVSRDALSIIVSLAH